MMLYVFIDAPKPHPIRWLAGGAKAWFCPGVESPCFRVSGKLATKIRKISMQSTKRLNYFCGKEKKGGKTLPPAPPWREGRR